MFLASNHTWPPLIDADQWGSAYTLRRGLCPLRGNEHPCWHKAWNSLLDHSTPVRAEILVNAPGVAVDLIYLPMCRTAHISYIPGNGSPGYHIALRCDHNDHHMRKTTSLFAAALIAFSIPLQGQVLRTDALAGTIAGDIVNDYAYHDLVGNDMAPTTDMGGAMQRSVMYSGQGYEVRVVAANGILRMGGVYSDAGLVTQHGQFNYYHPNGRLESAGMYVNGLKKGVWERHDAQGHDLAERVYGAGSYEELALEHGWVTMPPTLGR